MKEYKYIYVYKKGGKPLYFTDWPLPYEQYYIGKFKLETY
jgi:hypothetical protein